MEGGGIRVKPKSPLKNQRIVQRLNITNDNPTLLNVHEDEESN